MRDVEHGPLASLPRRDQARIVALVLIPLAARGLIKRRPAVVALAQRVGIDRRATGLLAELRRRHGPGPLIVRLFGRTIALPVDADDVADVLDRTPDPFSPATALKRAALRQFEPHGVLVSTGAERERRRELNEEVLEPGHDVHQLASRFATCVGDQVSPLRHLLARPDGIGWDDFDRTWWRIVHAVVFGDDDRGDTARAMLDRARESANWSFVVPVNRRRLAELRERTRRAIAAAAPGTLAALLRDSARDGDAPEDQLLHWLFAFDAAGIATYRAAAALAGDDAAWERAAAERSAGGGAGEVPFHRWSILEALRLWPTTPAILREQTARVTWRTGATPGATTVLVFAPLFHRDPGRVAHPDRFDPSRWRNLDLTDAAHRLALVPFSGGPAMCPGRNVVLSLTSLTLSALMDSDARLRTSPELGTDPAPSVFDHFHVRIGAASRRPASAS